MYFFGSWYLDSLSLFLFFAVDMFAVSVCDRKKISSLMRFNECYFGIFFKQ